MKNIMDNCMFGGVRLKKLKAVIAIIMVFTIIATFSGCSFRLTSFDNLMRPPKLIGKYQGLQDAFENAVKEKFSLLTPENGDHQSSFVIVDIDNDGLEEAFVFYVLTDTPEIAKVSFFRYFEGKWKFVATQDGLGNTVDKVIVSDLDNDNKSEVLIGWYLFSSKTNRAFSEYSVKQDTFNQIASYPYTHFDVVDVNGDGCRDVLTLTVDTSVQDKLTAMARVYNLDQNNKTLSLYGETAMDGNISAYSSVTTETVNNTNYIYVESAKGLNESITEVVFWDAKKNSLVSPLFDIASQSTILTWRNINLSVYDVDSDKFLEIPTSVEMPGSNVTTSDTLNSSSTVTSDNNPATKMYFTKWVKYRDGKLVPVQYSIVNKQLGYMLNVKSSWVGRITVCGTDGQWDYYRWNATKGEISDLLFSVYTYDNEVEQDAKKFTGYEILKTTSERTYVYRITDEGRKFGISDDWLIKSFILTDFGGLR